MPAQSTNLLDQGITAARSGKNEDARALLMHVILTEPNNVQAWLWLSGVVEGPERVRHCLEQVLRVEPTNGAALRGLEILGGRGHGATNKEPHESAHNNPLLQSPPHLAPTNQRLPVITDVPSSDPGAPLRNDQQVQAQPAALVSPPLAVVAPTPTTLRLTSADQAVLRVPVADPTLTADPNAPTWPVTVMSAMWALAALLTFVMFLGALFIAFDTGAPRNIGRLLGSLLATLVYAKIAIGLKRGSKASWGASAVFTALWLFAGLCVLGLGLLAPVQAGGALILLIAVISLILPVVNVVCCVLSYRQFFGPRPVAFAPTA